MDKIILNKIDKMSTSGLFILDAPTGLGKTFSVINSIKSLLESGFEHHIFYITNLKKNIPEEKLLTNLEEQYQDRVHYLLSNVDNIIKRWPSNEQFNALIVNSNEYKTLKRDLFLYSKIQENDKDSTDLYISRISESEKQFRKFIKDLYFTNKDYNEKQKAIEENPWIKELFPTIDLKKYKVILMSTDKFINPIDSIINGSIYIYDQDYFSNSIVFIDEFDTSKEKILNKIIDDGIKNDTDIFRTFLQIYNSLTSINVPESIVRESKKLLDKNKPYSIQDIINENTRIFSERYKAYHLNYLLKLDDDGKGSTFLFDDRMKIHIIRRNTKKKLRVSCDTIKCINRISTASDNHLLEKVVRDVANSIDHFINGIQMLSRNYLELQREDKFFTYDESVSTVLSIFNLNADAVKYIKYRLSYLEYGDQINMNDATFNKNGLQFIEIEDSTYHNEHSSIRLYSFPITPEEFLLKICMVAKVIGLSATGTIESYVGNYDLNYMRKHLKEKYYEMTDDDKAYIKRLLMDKEQSQKYGYPTVKVCCVDEGGKLFQSEVIEDLTIKLLGVEFLDDKAFSQLKDYKFIELLKLLETYTLFLKSSSKSLIAFLNATMSKEYNVPFNYMIESWHNRNIQYKRIEIVYISGINFNTEIKSVQEKLSNGNKVFVVTTYATVSYGKNIQYPLTDEMKDTVINPSDRFDNEKDFEAIYLQTPSNLLKNLQYNSMDKYKDISKFLFEQEYQYNGKRILYQKLKTNITRGFRKIFIPGTDLIPISNKGTELYFLTLQKTIQALGRINRSRYINKNSTIYIDEEILYRINEIKKDFQNQTLNFNLKVLLDHEFKVSNNKNILLFNDFNLQAKMKIDTMVKELREGNDNVIEWKKLRNYVLMHPTLDDKNKLDRYHLFYFTFEEEVSYYTFNLKNLNIDRLYPGKSFGNHEVSIIDCGLNIASQNEQIRDHLKELNIPVTFDKSRVKLLPATYIQIYKGGLGEIVGKFIIESTLKIKLQEINDIHLYELFDYRYNDIYIDLKNWNYIEISEKDKIKKIRLKLKAVNGSKAIIVNVFKKYGVQYKVDESKKIFQISNLLDENGDITDYTATILHKVFNL